MAPGLDKSYDTGNVGLSTLTVISALYGQKGTSGGDSMEIDISKIRVAVVMLVVVLFAPFIVVGGVGGAETGHNFILGKSNSADATTSLQGTVDGAQFSVTNAGSGAAIKAKAS